MTKAAFAVWNAQVCHGLAYPFGNAEGLFFAGLRHDNGKFFASVAKNFIRWPQQHSAHGFGHTGKAVVARKVPVGIVVELEVIHINHGHAHNTSFACQPPHFFLQGFVKVAAVEYAGEVVLDANFFQLVVGCLKPTFQTLAQTDIAQKQAY